jgi:DNA-binding NtrC family response regulator
MRAGRFRYEAELPSLMTAQAAEDFGGAIEFSGARGQLTAMLVEPERQSQRRLLALFGEMNHRLVPVTNIEEAADLAERMRFDVVFASTRPEGGTWTELFHRLHHRTPHFVVLSEGTEEQGAELIDGSSAIMMKKPVEPDELRALIGRLQMAPSNGRAA